MDEEGGSEAQCCARSVDCYDVVGRDDQEVETHWCVLSDAEGVLSPY